MSLRNEVIPSASLDTPASAVLNVCLLKTVPVGYADVTSPATAIRTVASAKNHPSALTIGRDGCSPLTCCYNNGRLMVVEGGQEFTAVALEVRESPTTAST